LGGFASALILGMVSLGIGVESVMRLLQPTDVQFGSATLIAIVGLIVNIVSALLLGHGHSHGHDHSDHDHHHHGHDNNLKSAYFHVIADALTSVLAIVALLAGRYLGWVWLDPVMGIVGAIVIARWAWSLMSVTAAVLLDQTDAHVAEEIRELVEKNGDATITDLHVWQIGPQAHAAIVSVVGDHTVDADSIRERLKPVHEISHLTVEYRPV
jgi:cation diffusion facilitator family transporter